MSKRSLETRYCSRRRRIKSTLLCSLCVISSGHGFLLQPRLRPPTWLSAQTSPRDDKRNKKKKGQRFAQSVHLPNNAKRSSPQSHHDKSIEQLEERLTARWGTELTRWTSDDRSDGDEEWFDDPTSEVDGEAPMFRARPVQDPWQTEDDDGPSFLGNAQNDNTEWLTRRARKNQERMRTDKRTNYQPNVPSEFDDEHDVGYEAAASEIERNDARVDQALGGKGTFQNTNVRQDSFFFSPAPSDIPQTKGDDVQEHKEKAKRKRERREKKLSVPILDEDGKPILLTLEQAQREFEDSLEGHVLTDEDNMSTEGIQTRIQTEQGRSWKDLGVTSSLLIENLKEMGCGQPLSVQDKACPSIIEARDVVIGTYTGSGKTLAFLVPLTQRLLKAERSDNSLKVLIVAPGRELASQIVSVARELLQETDLSVMLAIGGTTFGRNLEQIRKRKPTILVGTPGRIAELVVGRPGEKSGRLKTSNVDFLVLDEFDALLEYKPHREPTNAIIQCLKQKRGDRLQSVLCSATASDMLGSRQLKSYLREGYDVAMADDDNILITSVDSASKGRAARVSRTVIHGVVHIPHKRFALEVLRRILHTEPLPQQILVFVENSRKVKIVVEKLEEMGIIAAPLHGGTGSDKMDRAEVSKALREGYVGIVITTELGARGLDAPFLTHVINLDLPTDASHYAHRAGRCGRGGRPGVVINITTSPQERNVPLKFADKLGINLRTVEPRNGKLNIVDPSSQDID